MCTSEVSTIFFGVVLEDLIVSKTSSTLTILFLFGVTAGPFWLFVASVFAGGLKISDVFTSSALVSSAFVSSIFFSHWHFGQHINIWQGAVSLASVAEGVPPTNAGTVAGSI